MREISTKEELIANIETLENYIVEGNDIDKEDAISLIKRGTCFVAYKINNEIRFAPSRFIGYIHNALDVHNKSTDKDGRITNKAINTILKTKPLPNDILEDLYLSYCESLCIMPNKSGAFGAPRKYWQLEIEKEFCNNELLNGEFPEGKLVERIHKSRERNKKVINYAKQRFIEQHGKLICQVCNFDFQEKYGELGTNFIEAHHTIPVSEMDINHKTKIEDIVLVCSNCHRMIHKKRPWLSLLELKEILK